MNQTDSENPYSPIKAEIVDEQESTRPDPSAFILNIGIAILCAFYIINPTAGILEFIPDNLPVVGNLDEATATAGLLYALSNLRLIPWRRKS